MGVCFKDKNYNLTMTSVNSIIGGVAEDLRGSIRFVNDFDMTAVEQFFCKRERITCT